MTSNSAIISIRNLSRIFPAPAGPLLALDKVDLDIRSGEFLSIAGPSGSGKTTLFNLIGGLDAPSGGEIRFQGTRLRDMSARKRADLRCRGIGFVFQTFNLCETMTAAENVMLPALLAGKSVHEARDRALALLERIGLANRARHRPAQLSGGQQQRVALARALANEPLVLLADEPTGNLDPIAGKEIIALMANLKEETGVAVVAATHDPAMLEVSDRVVHLDQGRLTEPVPARPGAPASG